MAQIDITRIAYERYRLDWMIRSGYTLTDLMNHLAAEQWEDESAPVNVLFETWEADCGFSGALWVCYDEFMETEIKDRHYMLSLLYPNYAYQDMYLDWYKENIEKE